MRKFKLNYFLLILFSGIISLHCYAQEISDIQVKTAFLHKFLDYVKWEDESSIETFIIGIYGDDPSLLSTVKSIEKITVKEKNIKVVSFGKASQITKTHLLMVTHESRNELPRIFDRIKSTNTLLVSDRCDFKRSIMINFIHNEEGKVEFEINPKNMADENLYASPKLLLIGGKEIDVRQLYLETEKSLQVEKERAENIEQQLADRLVEIETQNTKLKILNEEVVRQNRIIDSQMEEINNQRDTLKRLLSQTHAQEEILAKKIRDNQKLTDAIVTNELQLQARDIEINQKDSNLMVMEHKINNYTILRSRLEEKISRQLDKINTQETVLILVLVLLSLSMVLIFLVFRNYRIKKQANKILEKLSIVASETDNAVMIMDKDGRFEWINEGFTRLYGYSFDEFVKEKGNGLINASANPDIESIVNKCFSTKKSIIYETTSLSASGEKLYIQTTLTPIHNKHQKIIKLVAIDTDISEIKKAEAKILQKNKEIQEQANSLTKANIILEEQKEKLQETLMELKNTQIQLVESEKMASLGLLTAGLAHEINNPVNFINAGIDGLIVTLNDILPILNKYDQINNGNSDKILKEINSLKKEIGYHELVDGLNVLVNNIKTGASRTAEIVKSLRTFSRLDESELKFSDIHENIESTIIMLRNSYKERIEIIKEYGNIPKIECYPGKLNQVLMNILLNAIQAIEDKGEITIRTSLPENTSNLLLIEISDTGTGISDDVIPHIFEPFYTTKDIGQGTGLGLSISYSVVEKHNGKIEVESELGKGTKFAIYLPIIRNTTM